MAGAKNSAKKSEDLGAHFWVCTLVGVAVSVALDFAFDLAWWQRALAVVATVVVLEAGYSVVRRVRQPADA